MIFFADMNQTGLVEVENSTIVVGFKWSCPLLISHHGALCSLDTAINSGLSDQGTDHGGSVLQCLGNTAHYLVSFF